MYSLLLHPWSALLISQVFLDGSSGSGPHRTPTSPYLPLRVNTRGRNCPKWHSAFRRPLFFCLITMSNSITLQMNPSSPLHSSPPPNCFCPLKKMHNLKTENCVLFGRLAEDFSPGHRLSGGSEGPLTGWRGVFKEKSWNIDERLQFYEKACIKLMNLALFLRMGRWKSLGLWKSCLWPAP